MTRVCVLSVFFTNHFTALKPKIGCWIDSLITKNGTYKLSACSRGFVTTSNLIYFHPAKGISLWLPHCTRNLSHGSRSSPILSISSTSEGQHGRKNWGNIAFKNHGDLRGPSSPLNSMPPLISGPPRKNIFSPPLYLGTPLDSSFCQLLFTPCLFTSSPLVRLEPQGPLIRGIDDITPLW